jgi:hypothetical protein
MRKQRSTIFFVGIEIVFVGLGCTVWELTFEPADGSENE